MNYTISNNEHNGQFEIMLDEHKAELVYRIRENSMYIMHTGVPDAIGNRGIGRALAEHALKYSMDNNYQLVVYCPFVKAYIKRHPNWREELAK